ncbi:MAG: glyoxalase/bleomycin resistance/dioxygenase family protein [Oscillospiraceae bacterium]|jgi:catechol 2,3-dioxygenase-like lactoylglutathione lyase family enzyme|nr:glyoxalase/bleomycin resistance/dioxygenase family protein [Oscillospiraceae bacterium]
MKFGCPLIAVKDMAVSRRFYEAVLRQKASLDLGANLTFGEGDNVFALQADFQGLIGSNSFDVRFGGNDHELFFEESDFDEFEKHLSGFDDIVYVHGAKEYPWGQRVIRFYDPDHHVIEVGESMEGVFKKFHSQGMTIEEVAERTQHPVEFVKRYIEENEAAK